MLTLAKKSDRQLEIVGQTLNPIRSYISYRVEGQTYQKRSTPSWVRILAKRKINYNTIKSAELTCSCIVYVNMTKDSKLVFCKQ